MKSLFFGLTINIAYAILVLVVAIPIGVIALLLFPDDIEYIVNSWISVTYTVPIFALVWWYTVRIMVRRSNLKPSQLRQGLYWTIAFLLFVNVGSLYFDVLNGRTYEIIIDILTALVGMGVVIKYLQTVKSD